MASTSSGAPTPKKRNHRETRLANLQAIQIDGTKRIEADVRQSLGRWYDLGGVLPATIEVRAGFLRRLAPLTATEITNAGEIVDRPKPDLPRAPALARLTAIPKGVALRTALTLMFLVQTNPKALQGKGKLDIPFIRDDKYPLGLIDLIAINATHKVGEDGGEFAATTTSNRQRQIRSALIALETIGLVSLPAGKGRGSTRFNEVRLHSELGKVDGAEPPVYTPPAPDVETLQIPVEFFLQGWVHSLTNREIANWLMYRDRRAQYGAPTPNEDGNLPHDLRVGAYDRLVEYDLTRATWDTHGNLTAFGLLSTWTDPRRRYNGTTPDGKRVEPHRFQLTDDGLLAPGLETVMTVLKNDAIPLNL
ncbi:hypothetical protein [Nocardia salmonicida]|uniref:hypothetical protein n=1 Tax=Nocardia salmonicida TaxID=53431 RepID=UPI0037B5B326